MRILKVIHAWPPEGRGGTEAHAAQAGQALSGRGHQVGVFARTGRPGQPEYEVTTEWQGNIGITRINNTFMDSWTFPWMYKNARVHEAFEREVDEFKPDLIHIHHLTGLSTTIVEAAKSRGLPTIMTLHDFWMVCPRGQRMMSDLHLCEDLDRSRCYGCLSGMWPHIFNDQPGEPVIVNARGELSPKNLADWDRHIAYTLNLCDLLVTPSAFHRERMLEIAIDPDRVVSLPHGMDHAPFAAPKREVKPVERIGFIGAVIPVKGVHILIDAFRRIGRPDIQLDIHGEIQRFHEDDGYEARLREQARGAGNIHLHGGYDVETVPSLLQSIDLLVVPSLWWETFCLTIREGLLAGIPVVASDLGAMREALDGEQDGVFFRPGDAADLAERLVELIDDDARRARFLNRSASVKALSDYVEELEDVYASAIRISQQRQGNLVIAPPHFPPNEASPEHRLVDLSTVPWEEMGVTMNQAGTASFQVQTRLPTAEDPSFEVGIRVTDEDRESGRLDLEIDLAPLGEADHGASQAPPTAVAGSPAETRAEPRQGEGESRGSRRRKERRARAESTQDDTVATEPSTEPEPPAPSREETREPDSDRAAPATEKGSMNRTSDQRRKPSRSRENRPPRGDQPRREDGDGQPRREDRTSLPEDREDRPPRGDKESRRGTPQRDGTPRRGDARTEREPVEGRKRTTVRRVPPSRTDATRTERQRPGSATREDVPRGGLQKERWTVDRREAATDSEPDEA